MNEVHEFERRVTIELYKEYRQTLSERRIQLRPAAIALFGSEQHWGKWDPLTRTILISRTLVHNHHWFHVVAILRHEMAHQLSDESQILAQQGPHGERFKQACVRLGVPREFSKATANLRTHSIDWREESRDETSEKLTDKVRKLLALATSSNEHEALSAMNKVRELYAKYHLEEVSSTHSSPANFAHLVITHGKKRIEAHQNKIISLLVGHFFVQVVTFRTFVPSSGEHHRAFEIIGARQNVLMAEYVYYFLLRETEYLAKQAAAKSASRQKRMLLKSLRLGILEGFEEKLTQAETPTQPIGTALVQFQKDPHLKRYLKEVYPRLVSGGSRSMSIDPKAYQDGKSLGKTLSLNKAVTVREGFSGRLLK